MILEKNSSFHSSCRSDMLFQPIKEKFFVVFNFEFFQEFVIFFSKAFLSVMFRLVAYIFHHAVKVAIAITKRAIALLPTELGSG